MTAERRNVSHAARYAGTLAIAAFVSIAIGAAAENVDPRRPRTIVVGVPRGPSPMMRTDSRRTGLAGPLPAGPIRIAWRKPLGIPLENAPLVSADGRVSVLTTRGELIVLDRDGEELGRSPGGAVAVGPPAFTSDGTIVYVTGGGDAVGLRSGARRFSTHLGGDRAVASRVAPLPLEDGGMVVATSTELVALDSEGAIRARAAVPEPLATPLLAVGRAPQAKVVAIAASGAVYLWAPGREAVRAGSFGSPVDGGAALLDDRTLLAVIEGNHLAELDLTRGVAATRSIASTGFYLGPPAVRGQLSYLLAVTPGRVFALAIDAQGQELTRALIAISPPQLLADGGPAPLTVPPHAGTIVDLKGSLAFVTTDGVVGVVTPTGGVDTLGDPLCGRASGRSATVGGLAAAGPGAFVVACDNGTVAKLTGP